MNICKILSDLCTGSAPSGQEESLARQALELLRPVTDEVWLDRFGNAVGVRRCGKPGARRLLLDAHLDEIGLLITGAEEGFLRFRAVGGVDPRMLPDQEVTLLTDPPRFGLIACLPPHVQKAGEGDKGIPLAELHIDAGLSQEEGERLIGTFAVFRGEFRELLHGKVSAKSLDDRAGFVTLLRTAELLHDKTLDTDLYFLGSTREETGGSGALVGAFALRPDCCIAVDVTHGRTPDGPKEETFPIGEGPAIGIGPNMTRWMTKRMLAKANQLGLPWHSEVMTGNTGTNAWKIQTAREGIATGVVSIPLKYMHSPVETLDIGDLENTARLLAAFAENLAGEEGASFVS